MPSCPLCADTGWVDKSWQGGRAHTLCPRASQRQLQALLGSCPAWGSLPLQTAPPSTPAGPPEGPPGARWSPSATASPSLAWGAPALPSTEQPEDWGGGGPWGDRDPRPRCPCCQGQAEGHPPPGPPAAAAAPAAPAASARSHPAETAPDALPPPARPLQTRSPCWSGSRGPGPFHQPCTQRAAGRALCSQSTRNTACASLGEGPGSQDSAMDAHLHPDGPLCVLDGVGGTGWVPGAPWWGGGYYVGSWGTMVGGGTRWVPGVPWWGGGY